MTAPDNERPSTEDVRVSDEAERSEDFAQRVRRGIEVLMQYPSVVLDGFGRGRIAREILSASGYPQLLEEAERECVRLAGERDELAWTESEARGERDHLRERVAELEAALAPFVEYAAKMMTGLPDSVAVATLYDNVRGDTSITRGDLLRARAALAQASDTEETT